MSFLPYPQYKDSGVEWLGQIPSGWLLPPLAVRYEILLGKMLDEKRITGAHPVPYLRNQDVQWDAINTSDLPIMDIAPDEDDRYTVRRGDLLVCEGGEVGRAAIWSSQLAPCGFQKALHRLRPRRHGECVRYLFYCLRFAFDRGVFVAGANPNTISHLTGEMLRRYPFPAPSIEEQEAIATFLDDETAKLDLLVAEQQRLIELLREKQQAVISHAVTKGLNPNAPMKVSGVEWLGEVPAHWTVSPVSARYAVQLGKMLDSAKITGRNLRPYLRVADVQWGSINTKELPLMDFNEGDRARFALSIGDIIVNEGGSYVGRSAIWRGELDECYYQKALHRLRARNQASDDPAFFLYVMFFATTTGVFVAGNNQNTIDHLPAEKLRRYRFAFPSLDEQRAIANRLDAVSRATDRLVAEAERAISLLQERRTALISAAVTGKIDVRHLADAVAA